MCAAKVEGSINSNSHHALALGPQKEVHHDTIFGQPMSDRNRDMEWDRGTWTETEEPGIWEQGQGQKYRDRGSEQMDRETGTEVGAETGTRVEFRFSLSLYYTSR